MKKIHLITGLWAFLLLMSACQDEQDSGIQNNDKGSVSLSVEPFKVDNGGARSEVTLTPDFANFTWSANDEVGIFPKEGGQVGFPMTQGAGASTAKFDGGGWALKPSSLYIAYYPLIHNLELKKESLPLCYDTPTLKAYPLSHDGKVELVHDYMDARYRNANDQGGVDFKFKHLGALIELEMFLPVVTLNDNQEFRCSINFDAIVGDKVYYFSTYNLDVGNYKEQDSGSEAFSFIIDSKSLKGIKPFERFKIYKMVPKINSLYTISSLKVEIKDSKDADFKYLCTLDLVEPAKMPLQVGHFYRIPVVENAEYSLAVLPSYKATEAGKKDIPITRQSEMGAGYFLLSSYSDVTDNVFTRAYFMKEDEQNPERFYFSFVNKVQSASRSLVEGEICMTYPYIQGLTLSGEEKSFVLNVPAKQTYVKDNVDASAALLTGSSSSYQNIVLNALTGVLRIPLKGKDKIKKIELCTRPHTGLVGDIELKITSSGISASKPSAEAVSPEVIELDCSANGGVQLDPQQATDFCFSLRDCDFSKGLPVKITDMNDRVAYINLPARKIVSGKIADVPVQTPCFDMVANIPSYSFLVTYENEEDASKRVLESYVKEVFNKEKHQYLYRTENYEPVTFIPLEAFKDAVEMVIPEEHLYDKHEITIDYPQNVLEEEGTLDPIYSKLKKLTWNGLYDYATKFSTFASPETLYWFNPCYFISNYFTMDLEGSETTLYLHRSILEQKNTMGATTDLILSKNRFLNIQFKKIILIDDYGQPVKGISSPEFGDGGSGL